ncbi:Melanoma inhibitory activity protein 2 [Plecturocebus cupreus]
MIFTTLFQMNEEPLKIAIKDTLDENSQLQESQKQLLQEAAVWKEQVSELNKQKITLEDSKVHAEQVLSDKDNHIKTLTECLLKMKDWAATLGEDRTDGDNLKLEMNTELEYPAYFDHPPKGALKKLIHAAKFNASFKSLEREINQIYIQSSEIDKMKEELTEREEEEAQEAQGILWTTRLNERGESSSDMLADSHRGPSDAGPCRLCGKRSFWR